MELRQPTNLMDAIRYYQDKDVCRETLVSVRWPDGVVKCPHCQSERVSFMESVQRYNCKGCRKQFSVKQGTVFEGSNIELGVWFCAMWLLGNAKNGVSSCEIARSLGITQKTAWFVLMRIREAVAQGSFEKLSGTVQADETYPGGKSKNMHADKRRAMREKGFPKPCVFGLLEEGGEVHTKVLPDATRETVQREIAANVEPGSMLYSDSGKAYDNLSAAYGHERVNHNIGQYTKVYDGDKVATTNALEGYWNLLDRTDGTYVHRADHHLPRYLAEEDFRYNSRTDTDGERFFKMLEGVTGKRLRYEDLTQGHLQHMAPK